MEEKLFRGQRADTKEWVEGNLVYGCVNEYAYIVEFGNKELCRNYVSIVPETVSQYTGVDDKHGKKIWQGCKCKVARICTLTYGHIVFADGAYWFKDKYTDSLIALHDLKANNYEIEVLEA